MKIALHRLPFTPAQTAELRAIATDAGHEARWFPDDAPSTFGALADCEALMGYFPPELLARLPKLRWVQLPSAGAEKYCAALRSRPEVQLCNCSGAFGVAIAEYMLAGALMLLRRMPAYHSNQRARRWACMGEGRTIFGSEIALLGAGDVGGQFAARAKALGAHVRGVRRSGAPDPERFDAIYPPERVCEAVRGADVIAACLPDAPGTRGLISADCFAAMRPDAIFVNCGRGATVDEAALIRALRAGKLGGAVLDVFSVEPLPAESPLWEMENVIVTPHISGRDGDPLNRDAIFSIFCENLRRYLRGEPLAHAVHPARGY